MTITEQKQLLEKTLSRQKVAKLVRDVRIRLGAPARLIVTVEPGADMAAVSAAIDLVKTDNPIELQVGSQRSAVAL